MPHGICAMQDMTFFVKCDERELLPGFTAEADQLELLSRSKNRHRA